MQRYSLFCAFWQFIERNKDVVEEFCSYVDPCRRGASYPAEHNFIFEGPKDNHSKLDCVSVSLLRRWLRLGRRSWGKAHTIDVHKAGAVADQTLGRPQNVIQTYAQSDLLNDLWVWVSRLGRHENATE